MQTKMSGDKSVYIVFKYSRVFLSTLDYRDILLEYPLHVSPDLQEQSSKLNYKVKT